MGEAARTLVDRLRSMPLIDPTASIAPGAIVTGDVALGPGARVLSGAVLNGDHGAVVLGENVLVMENAVLRGRPHSSSRPAHPCSRTPSSAPVRSCGSTACCM